MIRVLVLTVGVAGVSGCLSVRSDLLSCESSGDCLEGGVCVESGDGGMCRQAESDAQVLLPSRDFGPRSPADAGRRDPPSVRDAQVARPDVALAPDAGASEPIEDCEGACQFIVDCGVELCGLTGVEASGMFDSCFEACAPGLIRVLIEPSTEQPECSPTVETVRGFSEELDTLCRRERP